MDASDGDEALLEDFSSEVAKCPTGSAVSLATITALQRQNAEILEKLNLFLGRETSDDLSLQKRKILVSDSEEEHADSANNSKSQSKRRREEYDMDMEIENLMNEPGSSCALDTSVDEKEFGSDQDELHDFMQEYENEEEAGPKVAESLAKLIDTMMKGKLAEEKLKEKFAQYKSPANCNLTVPRVNAELWDIMDHAAKTADLRSQAIQKTLLKSVCALASVSNKCVASKDPAMKTILRGILDGVGLSLKASSEISRDRRTKIVTAPQMNQKFRKLLSADIPVTDKLFGDDFKAVCASIETTSKLGQHFTVSARGRKFFPRPKNWDSQGQQRGRVRGRPWQQRGQGRPRGYQRGRGRNSYQYRRDQ